MHTKRHPHYKLYTSSFALHHVTREGHLTVLILLKLFISTCISVTRQDASSRSFVTNYIITTNWLWIQSACRQSSTSNLQSPAEYLIPGPNTIDTLEMHSNSPDIQRMFQHQYNSKAGPVASDSDAVAGLMFLPNLTSGAGCL